MRRPRVPFVPTVLVTLALAAGVRWIDVHPIEFRADEVEVGGRPESRDVPADVLVLVAPDAERRSTSFETSDWGYGWWNVAEQEFGRFALVAATPAPDLTRRRVVVVTAGARDALVDRAALRAFVESGGLLAIEQPDATWDDLTHATTGDSVDAPLALVSTDAATCAELALVPRVAGAFRSLVPHEDATTWMRSGDAPVITSRQLGRGVVLALGIDVGRAVTALQQGLPEAGSFGVANRHPCVLTPHLQSNDLVADASLLGATVPIADVLERVVVSLLETAGPLPRWWVHADAAPGTYLATHDEESMGDRGAWMAEAERRWGRAGSDFVVAGARLTHDGAGQLGGPGRTLGLHHVDTLEIDARRHEFGLGPFRPLVRPWTLAEQADAFEALVGRRARSNRNHYLLWDTEYARPFRRMAAAGIAIDSTYGPDMGATGYLFGTGLPFRALDHDGLPLAVRELPFETAEDLGGADRTFLWRLLRESATRHHQAVTSLFHPNVFAWRPDAALFATWRDAFDEAQRLGLHVTDVESFVDAVAARGASSLTSTWDGDTLLVHVDARHAGATLALPTAWADRDAVVTCNGILAAPPRVEQVGGDMLLLVLSPGPHTVGVAYPAVTR